MTSTHSIHQNHHTSETLVTNINNKNYDNVMETVKKNNSQGTTLNDYNFVQNEITTSEKIKHSLRRTYDMFVGNVTLKPFGINESLRCRIKAKIISDYVHEDINTSGSRKGKNFVSDKDNVVHKLENNDVNTPFLQLHDKKAIEDMNKTDQNTLTSNKSCSYSPSSQILSIKEIIQDLSSSINKDDILFMNNNTISASKNETRSIVISDDIKNSKLLLNQSSSFNTVKNNTSPDKDNLDNLSSITLTNSNNSLFPLLNFKKARNHVKPTWHSPWKLHKVICGHQGWVQCVAVDPTNEWFATGGNDRLVKIWDLASGKLKLSLTGHINAVKSIVISDRHPYMFTCSEDNKIKCWDLEQNKVVRDYHGHLSGVYCLSLHPSLDIISSGGRDAVVRVWDIRTQHSVHVLSGHQGTIMSLLSQNTMPNIISGSQDKQVRLWDLVAAKCFTILTHHKKSIRSMALHPTENTFCSCAADNIKVWLCPNGVFDRNVSGHNAIVNCCAIRSAQNSSVLIAGTNNGQIVFWDWSSGYKFDVIKSKVQPGSLECENGIFACALDKSETRLITGECDKTIKIWKEDEDTTPESHPIDQDFCSDTKYF